MIVTPYGFHNRSADASLTLERLHTLVEAIETDVIAHHSAGSDQQLQVLLELKAALDAAESESKARRARSRTAAAERSGVVIALRR
jgi:hypothetical protein